MLSDYGWQIKTWKLSERDKMEKWIEKHKRTHDIQEIFVNNAYAVEYIRLINL